MNTVPRKAAPQSPAVAPELQLPDIGSAQHTALLRWFARSPISDTIGALQANPRFPCIACSDQPRHFAPARGTPRPAA